MSAKLDSDQNLGVVINDIARLLRRNFNRRVQSLGLTQAQWRAIVHLSRREGMTQVALADSLEIQPITLTRLIDRMAAAGWVERRAHPLDRRALQLYLTPKSQPILEQMHARAADTLSDAFSGMPANAQKQLIDALQLVKHNLAAAETTSTATQASTRTNTDARRQTAKPRRPR